MRLQSNRDWDGLGNHEVSEAGIRDRLVTDDLRVQAAFDKKEAQTEKSSNVDHVFCDIIRRIDEADHHHGQTFGHMENALADLSKQLGAYQQTLDPEDFNKIRNRVSALSGRIESARQSRQENTIRETFEERVHWQNHPPSERAPRQEFSPVEPFFSPQDVQYTLNRLRSDENSLPVEDMKLLTEFHEDQQRDEKYFSSASYGANNGRGNAPIENSLEDQISNVLENINKNRTANALTSPQACPINGSQNAPAFQQHHNPHNSIHRDKNLSSYPSASEAGDRAAVYPGSAPLSARGPMNSDPEVLQRIEQQLSDISDYMDHTEVQFKRIDLIESNLDNIINMVANSEESAKGDICDVVEGAAQKLFSEDEKASPPSLSPSAGATAQHLPETSHSEQKAPEESTADALDALHDVVVLMADKLNRIEQEVLQPSETPEAALPQDKKPLETDLSTVRDEIYPDFKDEVLPFGVSARASEQDVIRSPGELVYDLGMQPDAPVSIGPQSLVRDHERNLSEFPPDQTNGEKSEEEKDRRRQDFIDAAHRAFQKASSSDDLDKDPLNDSTPYPADEDQVFEKADKDFSTRSPSRHESYFHTLTLVASVVMLFTICSAIILSDFRAQDLRSLVGHWTNKTFNSSRTENVPLQQTTSPAKTSKLTVLPGVVIGDVSEENLKRDFLRAARRKKLAEMIAAGSGERTAVTSIDGTIVAPVVDRKTSRMPVNFQKTETPARPTAPRPQEVLPPEYIGSLSLRKAAAQGHSDAEYEVGLRFAKGKRGKRDYIQAAKWFKRSASKGFAVAQYRLATLYERGLGVDKDLGRARIWYQRAATQGNVKSMHNLAVLSTGQNGELADYTTAVEWFSDAAAHGLPDSQYNLAILYENGLGVGKDLREAHKWFTLASLEGDQEAKKRRDFLRTKMTAIEISKSESAALAWKAKPTIKAVNNSSSRVNDWGDYVAARPAAASQQIAEVQSLLSKLGYDIGVVDGQYGPKTRKAIKIFEKKSGLPVTGKVSEPLLKHLSNLAV